MAIMVAALLEAISVDEVGDAADLRIANYVILTIFTVEIALKLLALARKPSRYFHDKWNRFDFCVVFLACVATVDRRTVAPHCVGVSRGRALWFWAR